MKGLKAVPVSYKTLNVMGKQYLSLIRHPMKGKQYLSLMRHPMKGKQFLSLNKTLNEG